MRGYITHPLAMTVTIQPHRCFIRLPFFIISPAHSIGLSKDLPNEHAMSRQWLPVHVPAIAPSRVRTDNFTGTP